MVEAEGHLVVGFSFLCHSHGSPQNLRLTFFSRPTRIRKHFPMPAPQLSSTHQAALSAPHVALKRRELMTNICPPALKLCSDPQLQLIALFQQLRELFFFFLEICQCCLEVIILKTAKGRRGACKICFPEVFNFRNIPDELESNYFPAQ